jgi:hypothetical protein
MKRNLVGVVVVSTAAVLFVGCGDSGSKLSPAQKERCKVLTERWNTPEEPGVSDDRSREEAFKEAAALGC